MTYKKPSYEELKEKLTDLQFKVTQNGVTEPPFDNEFDDHFEKGLYVDVVTGAPLFTSETKYDAGCGWPAFYEAIDDSLIEEYDYSFGMKRVEVKSKEGDSHLGHVFPDGPKEHGGIRYCINSAALRFIPYDQLEEEGYGDFRQLFKNEDE